MDVPDPSKLEASPDDPDYPDLITVALPRSCWLVITTMVLRSLAKDMEEVHESWQENPELEEQVQTVLHQLTPVLLTATGPGPRGGPEIQRLQQTVDSLWDKYGERPSEEDWELADEVVMNLFQRLRELGVDPEDMEDVDPEDIGL